jgi:hypothetical protein
MERPTAWAHVVAERNAPGSLWWLILWRSVGARVFSRCHEAGLGEHAECRRGGAAIDPVTLDKTLGDSFNGLSQS